MNIQLSRPLVFIDLETTGLDIVNDRIVEISLLKIEPNGSQRSLTDRLNPEMPIPEQSSVIHGIYDKDVKDAATFIQKSKEYKQFIGDADLGGFNSNKFDIPVLMEEFHRSDIDFDVSKRKLIDVQNIFHKMEKRTLEAAYKFYCNKTLENAHSAEADVKATFDILVAQIERYPELKNTVSYLHDFSAMNNNADLAGRVIFNDKKEEVFNFGKYKGQRVEEVFDRDPSYYSWIMNSDFARDTKKVVTAIKLRKLSNN
jgi:DNA polymerase-3 subunit epsilon